jgi:pyruvate,water dikinase
MISIMTGPDLHQSRFACRVIKFGSLQNPVAMTRFILPFGEISIKDTQEVGGKNASLGEMISNLSRAGINVPDGFAITTAAYKEFIDQGSLKTSLEANLERLKPGLENLVEISSACRKLILEAEIPSAVTAAIADAYRKMSGIAGGISVAIRSSATSEDSEKASFAGQHDSFLNITGAPALLDAVRKCYASVFNERAIKYRIDNSFSHSLIGLSVGVQYMVRSDLGSAGVAFTIEPETGNQTLSISPAPGDLVKALFRVRSIRMNSISSKQPLQRS